MIKRFLKLLEREKEPLIEDFAILKTDLHSHLLPGIDDGANTIEDSINLILKLQEIGYSKLITTPHVMKGGYDNNPAIIREKLQLVKTELKSQNISIELEAAAEYYLDESFENIIDHNEELLLFGGNHVLFELGTNAEPVNLKQVIFKLNLMDIKPVLAHPERYFYMHDKSLSKYAELKEMGVLFQLNIASLTGLYTAKVKDIAERMIDAEYIDFLGSDLHNERHYDYLLASLKEPYITKIVNHPKLRNQAL